ncbi:hypothetical protein ACV56Z_02460 [Staphylococcus aureus]
MKKDFKVNGKRFKQIDYFNDKNNDNMKDAIDVQKPTSYFNDEGDPTGSKDNNISRNI